MVSSFCLRSGASSQQLTVPIPPLRVHRVAILLSDGPVPVDKVQIHLVDNIVHALFDMPEHRDIIGNVSIMVQAIRDVNPKPDDKVEHTKQRVMLRMLVTSAMTALEKGSAGRDSAAISKKGKAPQFDQDFVNGVSSSLLQNLPSLLTNYKSDVLALRDVTKLPPLVSSSILGLPARKADFQQVLKSLCQLYLQSNDKETLQNISSTLSQWVEGDHTRVSEVKMQMKRLSRGLVDRLMDLFRESDPESAKGRDKMRRSSKSKKETKDVDMFSASPEVETEHAIASQMLRLKILLMVCQATHLFEDTSDEDEESELDGLFKTISEAMGQRLKERKKIIGEEDTGTTASASSIWNDADPDLHEATAKSIDVSLQVLLLIVTQELAATLEARQDSEEDVDDVDASSLLVVRHRNILVKLLMMCFEQYIDEGTECSDDQRTFSHKVQSSAGQITSDLRSLFPHDFAEAVDPVRRAMSLQGGADQSILLGGFSRWFQNQDVMDDSQGNNISVDTSLTPLCRSIAVNMKDVS